MYCEMTFDQTRQGRPAPNSRFAKAGVSCLYESLVQGSNSVFQMNICAIKPRLRKYEKRYASC